MTYQQTIEDCNLFNPKEIKVIFLKNYGYIWIFPRDPLKKEVNLGIGFSSNNKLNLKDIIEKFKKDHNILGKINYVCGGLIPLGLQPPLKYKNILFVGDAGVGAFIISGQGIYRALISGDIAGMCIAKNHPNRYPLIIYKEFLQWNVLCKTFHNINFVFQRINPKLTLSAFNIFIRMTGLTH